MARSQNPSGLVGSLCFVVRAQTNYVTQRNATQSALSAVHARTDLLVQCDIGTVARDSDEMQVDNPDRHVTYELFLFLKLIMIISGGRSQAGAPPFFQTLIQYCAHRTNLMDTAAKMMFRHLCEQNLTTILTGDSTDAAAIEVRGYTLQT